MRSINNYTQKLFRKAAHLPFKRAFTIGIAACLFLSMAGCQSKENENTQTPWPSAESGVEAGLETIVVEKGGQLITYIPRDSLSLNPLYPDNNTTAQLLTLCYEPLIELDGDMNLSPSLAESWDSEENGQVWTLHLRQNVKWHDGTAFTAQDVIATIAELKKTEYAEAPLAKQMEFVSEYTALDDLTVRIVGTEPGMMVLYALNVPVISAHAFALGSKVVGTGPYELTRADAQNGLVFDVFSQWWRNAPYIERVVALRATDDSAAMGAMDDGGINFVNSRSLTTSSYREEGRISSIEVASQQMEILYVNHNATILQDKNIRKAIAYAINRRDVISKAYLNHAFATDVPVQPDSWLYNSDSRVYDYYPNLAIQLLTESGWTPLGDNGIRTRSSNGRTETLSLRLLVNNTPENSARKDAAKLIADNLAAIGIEVELVEASWSSSNNEYLTKLASGDFDLALAGFYLNKRPDLSPYLATDGTLNYGKYQSQDMDQLLLQVKNAGDTAALESSVAQLQSYFIEELPFIQLYFRTASVLFNDTLSIEGLAELREETPFARIESWHFDQEGRAIFPIDESIATLERWEEFDQDWPRTVVTDAGDDAVAIEGTETLTEEGSAASAE